MKKGMLSKFTVKRISSSPYFPAHFEELEKVTINKIEGAEMLPHNTNQDASVLITNTHTDVSKITEAQLEYCQLLIHPNSGYDNLSPEFMAKVKFPVILGNPIRANAVANYILSALLSHYSALPDETKWNPSRKWPRKLLSELNILILGHGHIGRLLSESLAPLARLVRIYDPYAGFPELDLKNIDVLIPVCSLNKKNHHMINRDLLLKLNNDFLLINPARGSLVNTLDLLDVLVEQPSASAVLDVFEKEPADFEQFNKIDNILVTSHIAGVYKNIDINTVNFEAQVILDFMNYDTSAFQNIYKAMTLNSRNE